MRITLAVLAILMTSISFGQTLQDVVRYTDREYYSTARSAAMSGSFSALGADASVSSTNPAGLALFKRSEITFTGNLFADLSSTNHYGSRDVGAEGKFGLGNLAYISTKETGRKSGVVQTTSAFGYNRLNDFHSQYNFSGVNNESSLLDVYYDEIAGDGYQDPNNWVGDPYYSTGSSLAFNTYLLDTITIDGIPQYFHMNMLYGADQRQQIISTGSMRETYFSYAWNINNRLLMGGTVSFLRLTYTQQSFITEVIDEEQSFNPLVRFTKGDYFETDGSAMSLKLGVSYKISDYVRLAAAYHSGSTFSLLDEWNANMRAEFTSVDLDDQSPSFSYNYELRTPPRTILGLAWIIGKSGAINVDYEQVNYQKANYRNGDFNYDFAFENDEISTQLRRNHNLRIGGEYRVRSFYLRGGAHLANDVYNKESDYKRSEWGASLGVGFKWEKFYFDAAWRMTHRTENHYMYDTRFVQASDLSTSKHMLVATIAYRWQPTSYEY